MSDNDKHGMVRNDIGSHLPELSEKDRAQARLIGNEIARIYAEKVRAYQDLYKTHPNDEYIKDSYGTGAKVHAAATEPADDSSYQRALKQSAERLTWNDLQVVFERDESAAVSLWRGVLDVALDQLKGGIYACETLHHVDSDMFQRAQFFVIRDSLANAWQPKDAIEMSMVEMLVQAFVSYHYWLRLANSMAAREYEAVEQKLERDRYGERNSRWDTPRITTADAIDRAIAMADRFNRLYLRTLRQMRDLRRIRRPNPKRTSGQRPPPSCQLRGGLFNQTAICRIYQGGLPYRKSIAS
jgi:hypothetical protein